MLVEGQTLRRLVPESSVGQRLDFTVRQVFGLSWIKSREWIQFGKVQLNGQFCYDPATRVQAGDLLACFPSAAKKTESGWKLYLKPDAIVHLDGHLVVVEKPSGIGSIPFGDDKDKAHTLIDLVERALRPKRGKALGRNFGLGVVHRIDKETSGLVVFTRSWLAKKSLASQFRFHTVFRRYLALVHGHPNDGRHESHLLQDRGDGLRGSWEVTTTGARRSPKPEGRRAVTHIKVLKRFAEASLVECQLETGRTHQIRIHLSELGHPLIGEKVYIRSWRRLGKRELSAPRLMLHASDLGFSHPKDETPLHFKSDPPADMEALLNQFQL